MQHLINIFILYFKFQFLLYFLHYSVKNFKNLNQFEFITLIPAHPFMGMLISLMASKNFYTNH